MRNLAPRAARVYPRLMWKVALALVLIPAVASIARADGNDGAKPADPPQAAPAPPAPNAPKLLEKPDHKPRTIAAHETHRDGDRVGSHDCETNALGQVECKAPPPPAHSTVATR